MTEQSSTGNADMQAETGAFPEMTWHEILCELETELSRHAAQHMPDPDHPDCSTDRERELYDALMGLASHATAWHPDYKQWTQGGVTLETSVSKALRLGSPSFPSTKSESPAMTAADTPSRKEILNGLIQDARKPADDGVRAILQNQIEIMAAVSLLLRYAEPDLVGKGGEMDSQRDGLFARHRATQEVLRALSTKAPKP